MASNAQWKNFVEGFKSAYGEGREDQILAHHRERKLRGKGIEAPRGQKLLATNRTATFLRDLTGTSKPAAREVREEMGLGLKPTTMGKVGQGLGVLAGDLTQDRTREAWWLLNAPQAVANVTQEGLLNKVRPDLFDTHPIMHGAQLTSKSGTVLPNQPKERPLTTSPEDMDIAHAKGYVDNYGNPTRGVSIQDGEFREVNHQPGWVDSLMIPSGIAVNAGIGLLNPMGGSGGYDAVFASDEDRTKTDNVVAEIAAKYILGRTGNLAPYEEFVKHRPDVSRGEYNAYKAFKWDKEGDINITDGDFTVPTGVLKGTMDGIHGPELQFLGRSLPVTTALIPIAATIAGTTIGASRGSHPIRNAFAGGMTALAGSTVLGLALENERRNRNMRDNMPKSAVLDPEGPVNNY